jgi:hypothetical protein
VLFTSLEHVYVLGVAGSEPSSSSYAMFSFRFGVFSMVLLSLSFDSINLPFAHAPESSSSTLLIIVLASTS